MPERFGILGSYAARLEKRDRLFFSSIIANYNFFALFDAIDNHDQRCTRARRNFRSAAQDQCVPSDLRNVDPLAVDEQVNLHFCGIPI